MARTGIGVTRVASSLLLPLRSKLDRVSMRCERCGRFARAIVSTGGGLLIAACTFCGTAPVMSTAGAPTATCGLPAATMAIERSAIHGGSNETAPCDDSPHTHQEFNSELMPGPESSVVRSFGPSFSAVPGLAVPGMAVPGNAQTEPLLI